MTNNLSSDHQLAAVLLRAQVIKAIRQFFDRQGFTEVIPTTLNQSLPLEPTLYAFETTWKTARGQEKLYLSTSPEASLKKMLAAEVGSCYALGKSFRNLENNGLQHNPEFLMLEWYEVDADYQKTMEQTQKLIQFVQEQVKPYLKKVFKLPATWLRLSLAELFKKYADLELEFLINENDIKNVLSARGYQVEQSKWEQLFNQVFLNEIEPFLPQTPFFLTDFPAQISPLCQLQAAKPWLAERFEVYLGGMEIGNGNTELLNADAVNQHFQTEAQQRKINNEILPPIDQDFLTALQKLAQTQKKYSGIGLGVDRLTMWLAGVEDIKLVEPFALSTKNPPS